MIAGAMTGGSMLGSLAQLGIGLGANSVLLRFSRSAESQADYNGALIMADAGYNPIEMARFFGETRSAIRQVQRPRQFPLGSPQSREPRAGCGG